MNREDIIRMAQEAGGFLGEFPRGDAWMFTEEEYLERFAALVASAAQAKEREACAKECEGINSAEDYYGERPELVCAEAIRARGKA